MENLFEKIYRSSRKIFQEIDPDFVFRKRESALENLKKQGLPTPKDEAWRKTDWKKWAQGKENIVTENRFELPANAGDFDFYLHNGKLFGKKSWIQTAEGVMMGSIREAFRNVPDLAEKYLFRLAQPKYRNFYPVNTMLFWDGFFLYVPEGVHFREKIRIFHSLDNLNDVQLHNRHILILENGSSAQVVWKDYTSGSSRAFVTDASEIFAGKQAELNYYRYQHINDDTALLNMTYSVAGEDARINAFVFELNGGLLRNEIYAKMAGTRSDVHWQGFYLPTDKQHFDNRIFIEHDTVNAQSNQAFKGILNDESTAIFNGYILVNRGAQQTNAYQQNANLLLSRKARSSSQPFLEIYADDVSCSHGSTTGQVNGEALFYLMQRGLDESTARRMLLSAFLGDILESIDDADIKEKTREISEMKLDGVSLDKPIFIL